jgi:dTDP-4-amino-4,6-dideoxygalactose transaminase
VTHDISERLVRLPLWSGMEDAQVELVIEAVKEAV